jgi:Heavy metal associated domain 2
VNEAPVRDRLRLVSHFPGRLRVRAEMFRVMPEIADEVAMRLREEPAVTGAETSRVTGSLLVTYDPDAMQLPRLVQLIVRTGRLGGLEVDASGDWTQREPPGERVRLAMERLNAHLREVSGGRLDGRVAVPGALLAGGLALLFRAPVVPNWWDLTFWAYSTFHNMNPPPGKPPTGGPDDGSTDEA